MQEKTEAINAGLEAISNVARTAGEIGSEGVKLLGGDDQAPPSNTASRVAQPQYNRMDQHQGNPKWPGSDRWQTSGPVAPQAPPVAHWPNGAPGGVPPAVVPEHLRPWNPVREDNNG
jgi:hypothetical protein